MDQLIKSACENHLIRRPMSGIHKNPTKIRLILNKTKEFYKMLLRKVVVNSFAKQYEHRLRTFTGARDCQ